LRFESPALTSIATETRPVIAHRDASFRPLDLRRAFADHQLHELKHAPRTVAIYLRRLDYAERLTGKAIEDITGDD
jgi:hypothetical protein